MFLLSWPNRLALALAVCGLVFLLLMLQADVWLVQDHLAAIRKQLGAGPRLVWSNPEMETAAPVETEAAVDQPELPFPAA